MSTIMIWCVSSSIHCVRLKGAGLTGVTEPARDTGRSASSCSSASSSMADLRVSPCPAEKSWLPKPNGSGLLKKNFKVKLLALCIDVCTEIP